MLKFGSYLISKWLVAISAFPARSATRVARRYQIPGLTLLWILLAYVEHESQHFARIWLG